MFCADTLQKQRIREMEVKLEEKQMEINALKIGQASSLDMFDNATQQIDYNMSYPPPSTQYDHIIHGDLNSMNGFDTINDVNGMFDTF